MKITVKVLSQSDNEGLVHVSVGVPQQDVWKAALQHVLAQVRRLFHNLEVRHFRKIRFL